MVKNTTRIAIHTDRALSAAHGGTTLASRTRAAAMKSANGRVFVSVPAYVVDQELHSPRGSTA